MALPTLTWGQTDYTMTGFTAPTDAQVIAAVNTAAANLTKWTKTASTADYVELQSPSVDGHKQKIIISVNPADNSYCLGDSQSTGIWMGLAPDAGTLGTWNSATPYGSDRWTKYVKCCETAKAESLYFVETDESLGIFFRDDSADDNWGFIAGAVIDPGANQAEADGRIYGIFTSGKRVISDTWWNQATGEFLGTNGSTNYSHAYAFRPALPTTLDALARLNTTASNTNLTSFQDGNGKENVLPVFWASNQNPWYFLGSMRQMYYGKESATRAVLSNGIVVASNSLGTNNAVYLLNE